MAWTDYRYTCQVDGEGAFACDLPFIVVKIYYQTKSMRVTALIDSGCTTTHIRSDIAQVLGIDLSAAKDEKSSGITGSATSKHVKVRIEVEGHGEAFESPAAFLPNLPVPMLLGQNNFFDKFNVKFEKSKQVFAVERVAG